MWKVEMLARRAGIWVSTGDLFDDYRKANAYANSMMLRWSWVKAVRIVPAGGSQN